MTPKPVRVQINNQVILQLNGRADWLVLLRFLRGLAREQLGEELIDLLRKEYQECSKDSF